VNIGIRAYTRNKRLNATAAIGIAKRAPSLNYLFAHMA
jgi:hypothetical protein